MFNGWNCVIMVMHLLSVFSLELHVKDVVGVICEAWLICSEFDL